MRGQKRPIVLIFRNYRLNHLVRAAPSFCVVTADALGGEGEDLS